MQFSRASVLALAPDAASSKAAQGLLSAALWPTLGYNDAAAWGECQGSGAKPYQAQVDLSGPTFKCSCPSRKFPCKHGLALLLLRAERSESFTASAPPAWVTEWLSARELREVKREATKKVATQHEGSSPADALAAAAREAKREAQRWGRIEQGAAELDRWMGDLLSRGLGTVSADKLEDWSTMAARLVDAQAPGLGHRLRSAAAYVGRSSNWPEKLLQSFGILALAIRAIGRRSALHDSALADLRMVVGWSMERADIAERDAVEGTWLVLGMAIEERDDKLTERRVWLRAVETGRHALILDHAFAGRGFEHAWVVGAQMKAALSFYPSAAPLRALAVTQPSVAIDCASSPAVDLDNEWQRVAQHFGECPWTPLQPVLLPAVVLTLRADGKLDASVGDRVLGVTVAASDRWTLLAVTGGHPVTLSAEWDGDTILPLTVWREGQAGAVWQRSLRS